MSCNYYLVMPILEHTVPMIIDSRIIILHLSMLICLRCAKTVLTKINVIATKTDYLVLLAIGFL